MEKKTAESMNRTLTDSRRLNEYDLETLWFYVYQADDGQRDVICLAREMMSYGKCLYSRWYDNTILGTSSDRATVLWQEDVDPGETDTSYLNTQYRAACGEIPLLLYFGRRYNSLKVFTIVISNNIDGTVTAPHSVAFAAGCSSGVSSWSSTTSVSNAVNSGFWSGSVSSTGTATSSSCSSTTEMTCSVISNQLACNVGLGIESGEYSTYWGKIQAVFYQDNTANNYASCQLNTGLNQDQCTPY